MDIIEFGSDFNAPNWPPDAVRISADTQRVAFWFPDDLGLQNYLTENCNTSFYWDFGLTEWCDERTGRVVDQARFNRAVNCSIMHYQQAQTARAITPLPVVWDASVVRSAAGVAPSALPSASASVPVEYTPSTVTAAPDIAVWDPALRRWVSPNGRTSKTLPRTGTVTLAPIEGCEPRGITVRWIVVGILETALFALAILFSNAAPAGVGIVVWIGWLLVALFFLLPPKHMRSVLLIAGVIFAAHGAYERHENKQAERIADALDRRNN